MKKLILLALAALIPAQPVQAAAGMPADAEVETVLNLGGAEGIRKVQLGTQVTKKVLRVMKAQYDFAIQGGGSTANINLLDVDGKDAVLPDNAVITQVLFDVVTAPVGVASTATLAFTVQSAADLKAALAIGAGTAWSGIVAGIPVDTAATAIKLTADRTPYLDIGVTDLTAGKINAFIEYYLSD